MLSDPIAIQSELRRECKGSHFMLTSLSTCPMSTTLHPVHPLQLLIYEQFGLWIKTSVPVEYKSNIKSQISSTAFTCLNDNGNLFENW